MKLEETWRWFGPDDPISLQEIRQTGASGIVTALHHIPNGEVWPVNEIEKRKKEIEKKRLYWSVVESIPVHEDIKRKTGRYKIYIENYKKTIDNLASVGISTVCYNFMPVLDWTRTDLNYLVKDGSTALRYDEIALATFDLFILKRKDAADDYSTETCLIAEEYSQQLSEDDIEQLTNTILAGLPGSEDGYSLKQFNEILESYSGIDDARLRSNLHDFLNEIIPVAEMADIRMAIHPDDPPFSLFGLPRVVSTENDIEKLLNAVDSPVNGFTFCTGSFGVRPDNDLPGMIERLGSRIHFIHLRNILREHGYSFHESAHLSGNVDMAEVMKGLIIELIRRKKQGRTDLNIPMRPDHGHQMLCDEDRESNPGYPLIGRMRGLAELRGLELGVRKSLTV